MHNDYSFYVKNGKWLRYREDKHKSKVRTVRALLLTSCNEVVISSKDGVVWELPGGHKRTDETLEECVVRELAEELQVESIVLDIPYVYVHLNRFNSTIHHALSICKMVAQKERVEDKEINRVWMTKKIAIAKLHDHLDIRNLPNEIMRMINSFIK